MVYLGNFFDLYINGETGVFRLHDTIGKFNYLGTGFAKMDILNLLGRDGHAKQYIINTNNANFIDSEAFKTMKEIKEILSKNGKDMKLQVPNSEAREVAELVKKDYDLCVLDI